MDPDQVESVPTSFTSRCASSRTAWCRLSTFAEHPYTAPGRERAEFKLLGETAYLEKKRQMFRSAYAEEPAKFVEQIATRLTAATLWYVPFWPEEASRLPTWVAPRRLVHPVPMLSLLFLLATCFWRPLHAVQWIVMGVYVAYLLPFIAITYYDRYAAPLLAAKVLLVIFAVQRIGSWRSADTEPAAGESRQEVPRLQVAGSRLQVPSCNQ